MISKELFFLYDMNFMDIYDLTLENNDGFIKIIPEIVFYQKGIWKDNKRIDIININITDIPDELSNIISLMKDKNGFIKIKIKIYKFINDDKIIIKTKLKLQGIIGTLINNAVKVNLHFLINNQEILKTDITVNYDIKSIFPHELDEKIINHVQHKLENYYIKIIDEYFTNLSLKNKK